MIESIEYCRIAARRDDPDRYLASLFAPPPARVHLWALIAFYHDIAKTREMVTETTIGLIRLQWWRDEIAKIYNGQVTEGNPVLDGLRTAIAVPKLKQEDFDTLIYAREFDLENVPPQNFQGLEHYVDYTNTPMNMLWAALCRAEVDRERVRYISIAYGLTGLLRSVVFHARQGRCYLPSDELQALGIAPDDIFTLKPLRDLPSITKNIAELATDHLTRATEIDHVRPFRALRALTRLYLKQLAAANYDVYSLVLTRPPPFKELRVWLGSLG